MLVVHLLRKVAAIVRRVRRRKETLVTTTKPVPKTCFKTKLQNMTLSSGSSTIYRNAEAVLWKQIENIANQIQEERLAITNPGLLDGKAGIVFAFQHLRNIGALDKSEDLNLSELDEFVSLGIDNDFKNGNWDPLHGMVGLGIYFLERNKETGEKKYLETVSYTHLRAH